MGNDEGVVCAYNVVRALLPVGGQVAIGQVTTGQTLGSHDTSAPETRQGEPWESDNVDLVGHQTRLRADGIVVIKFYVGRVPVPIVLSLVDDHSEHFDHSVVYPLNTPVTVGMIRACSKIVHTQQLKNTVCERLERNCNPLSESMVRGRPRKWDVLVHQDIGCTLHGELTGSDGKHVDPTTEAIGEEQDVGVASWCDRKGAEIVNTAGDTWTFRQRHRDDGPEDSQPSGFSRLAFVAVAKPPPGAHIHANSPIKPIQHAQRARGAQMI